MTLWLGLTGGIGSGKSLAATEFKRLGMPLIDADAISRSLTADNGAALPLIRKTFGSAVFAENGSLDRAALREIVFRRPQERFRLESLIHPLIISEINQQKTSFAQYKYGVIEMPLLVGYPVFAALADCVLVIDAPELDRIERVQQRSGLHEDEIRRIIAAQTPRLALLRAANDVIVNGGSAQDLCEKVRRVHRFYQNARVPEKYGRSGE